VKRFVAVCLVTGAVGVAVVPVASAASSSPPNCFGGEISTAAMSSPGFLGSFASGYAHFFNSNGTNLGQSGVPFAKATCPVVPPPPPSS
jgi:hypothetical protein